MSYIEVDPDLSETFPGIAEARAKVEQALMDFLTIVNPELGAVDWMPLAWVAGVEAVGYNEEGRKFRAFDLLYPEDQSTSATLGVSDLTRDGYIAAIGGAALDEDED